jgi:hypothetical protein
MIYDKARKITENILAEIDLIDSSYGKAVYHREKKDYEVSLWMLRNTLELICKNIYVNEISLEIEGVELRTLIKRIEEKGIIPKSIMPHLRAVQTFGNFGAHPENKGESGLNDVMLQPPFQNMEIILDWFKKEYQGLTEEQKAVSEQEPNSLQLLLSLNRFYEDDKNTSPTVWVTERHISMETIIIVVGTRIYSEIFDRIPAELLKKQIDDLGDYSLGKRAIIVTDTCYKAEPVFRNLSVISIGNKLMNTVTNSILSRNPGKVVKPLSTDDCDVINSNNNILFITEQPGGILEAVKKFIGLDIGLKQFLSIAWGPKFMKSFLIGNIFSKTIEQNKRD